MLFLLFMISVTLIVPKIRESLQVLNFYFNTELLLVNFVHQFFK